MNLKRAARALLVAVLLCSGCGRSGTPPPKTVTEATPSASAAPAESAPPGPQSNIIAVDVLRIADDHLECRGFPGETVLKILPSCRFQKTVPMRVDAVHEGDEIILLVGPDGRALRVIGGAVAVGAALEVDPGKGVRRVVGRVAAREAAGLVLVGGARCPFGPRTGFVRVVDVARSEIKPPVRAFPGFERRFGEPQVALLCVVPGPTGR